MKRQSSRSCLWRVWALFAAGCALAPVASGLANPAVRQVPVDDGPTGVTCESFNQGARMAWEHRGTADWLDAKQRPQGETPWSTSDIADTDTQRVVEWDLTGYVASLGGVAPKRASLLLRTMGTGKAGRVTFHSREVEQSELRPVLRLSLANGATRTLHPLADTFIDCSTRRSLGQGPTIGVGHARTAILEFEVPAADVGLVRKAVLQLTTTNRQNGRVQVGAFQLVVPVIGRRTQPAWGLAARYPQDRGLDKDPNVVAVIDHESDAWRRTWTQLSGTLEVVRAPHGAGDPVLGRALQVTIPTGKVTGANTRFEFGKRGMAEPDAMYVRYYLRFDSSWDSTVEGGKLPGFSGTYNRGGWGGRRSNGTNGWSMRGYFQRQPEPENPLAGVVSIGTYAYHANMPGTYGELWMWSRNALGVLERNRWYCIEQHVRLNDIGQANGVLRTWVDGELAFQKTDIRYRTVDTLKIEDFWLNVYHGGTKPVVSDQRLYVDNIVIARQYIGPMAP